MLGDASPPSSYLILDLPDLHYTDNLLNNPKLSNIKHLDAVFHFSPRDVLKSESYQQYIQSLGGAVKHIVLNESCQGMKYFFNDEILDE